MGDAKIKINIREGTFEIEGSESFVEKYWTKLESSLDKIGTLPIVNTSDHLVEVKPPKDDNKPKTRKKISMELIPLDLVGGNDKPSLQKFFEEKSPKTNQEIITLFCYYLDKFLGIKNMKYGHALFCYGEVNKPKPSNIAQLFADTRYYHKWVEVGDEPNTVKLGIAGENLIKHKLGQPKESTTTDISK